MSIEARITFREHPVSPGIESRCALGEIAYVLATARQPGRETRHLLTQAVGSSSKQTVQLLTNLAQSFRNSEGSLKALLLPQERSGKTLEASVLVLGEIKNAIEALSGDQQADLCIGLARGIEAR